MPGSTKAQMQIAEVVIVLMIFFMILGFGTLFFTNFAKDKAEEEITYAQALELAETAKVISALPELHCSLRGDEDYTCLDMYRVEAFADQINSTNENRRHYANTFQGYRARLECIYPHGCSQRLSLVLFDYAPPDARDIIPFALPVVIYDPLTREYAYGELKLEQLS